MHPLIKATALVAGLALLSGCGLDSKSRRSTADTGESVVTAFTADGASVATQQELIGAAASNSSLTATGEVAAGTKAKLDALVAKYKDKEVAAGLFASVDLDVCHYFYLYEKVSGQWVLREKSVYDDEATECVSFKTPNGASIVAGLYHKPGVKDAYGLGATLFVNGTGCYGITLNGQRFGGCFNYPVL